MIFARTESVGMLCNLRGLEKDFPLQINCFPKSIAISQFQPFSGNLGLIFLRLLQEVNLWGCYLTYGDYKNVFFYRKSVFQTL